MSEGDAVLRADLSVACDISLVIFRSDLDLLRRTLESLRSNSFRHLRLLVNDPDAYGDYERVTAEVGLDSACIQAAPHNLGFAAGHNRLAAEAFNSGATHVLVLNPDVVLEPGAVSRLLRDAACLEPMSLVSGVLLLGYRDRADSRDPEVIDSRGIRWTATSRHLDIDQGRWARSVALSGGLVERSGATGALILIPRSAHDRLVSVTGELFDEDFFAFREDAELGLRSRLLGIRTWVRDEPVATHYRHHPGTRRGDGTVDYLSTRNRMLLATKYRGMRPGVLGLTLWRDAVVRLALLTSERRSRPALRDARRVRPRMREKRARLLEVTDRADRRALRKRQLRS